MFQGIKIRFLGVKNNGFSARMFVFVFLTLFLCGINPALATSYEEQLAEINKEKQKIYSQLSEISSKEKTLENEIANYQIQINSIQTQINITQQEITVTNSAINETGNKIIEGEKELEKQKEIMNEYLRTMYIEGRVSTIELVASSNNFSDFVDRNEYLSTVQNNVQDTANKISLLNKELQAQKKNLEEKQIKSEQLKAEQVAQRNAVNSQQTAIESLLSSTQGDEEEYQKQLAQKKIEEAAVWAAYEAAINSSIGTTASTYVGGSGSGYLSIPISGYLTQSYGWTDFALECSYGNYPDCKIHNGYDLASSYAEAPIYAAADGIVLDLGYEHNSQGWGNWIAIKHPNGLVTLYAHQSSFAVTKNQVVTQGQLIGYQGHTGNCYGNINYGAHLHFSVYTNFVLYDTTNYHGPLYEGTVDPGTFL